MNLNETYITQKDLLKNHPYMSRVTLYRERRAGRIPFYRIANKVMYKLEDIVTYLEKHRVSSKPGRS